MSTISMLQTVQAELAVPQKDYASAKAQAQRIDDILGYRCQEIEDALFEIHKDTLFSSQRQFWYGLEVQSMQTPYSEIVEMVGVLKPQPGQIWMDMGAAFGRIGIVLGVLAPLTRFIGYEYVQARVDEGQRIFDQLGLKQATMQQVDLATDDFEVQPADLYFLYDFGSKEDIYKVLRKLQVIAAKRKITVIARGRGVRNWILMDFPWLYDVEPPRHFATWSLFLS